MTFTATQVLIALLCITPFATISVVKSTKNEVKEYFQKLENKNIKK